MSSSVLVIDDSLTVRMDLKVGLRGRRLCLHARCLAGGRPRRPARQRVFNLIVLDVQLPDGDGVEFLSELKATRGHRVNPCNPALARGGRSCPGARTHDRRRRICRQTV